MRGTKLKIINMIILVNLLSLNYAQKTDGCSKDEYFDHSVIFSGFGRYDIILEGSISDDKIVQKWGQCYYSNSLTVQISRDSILLYKRVLRKAELSKCLFPSWNKDEFILNQAKIMEFINYPFSIQILFSIAVPDTDDGFGFMYRIYEEEDGKIRDQLSVMESEQICRCTN